MPIRENYNLEIFKISGSNHRRNRRRTGKAAECLLPTGEDGVQGGADPGIFLPPFGRLLRDEAQEQLRQRRGHAGNQLRRRDGFLPEDGGNDLEGLLRLERRAAGQQLIAHDAERVEIVAGLPDLLAEKMLGRDVLQGPRQEAGPGEGGGVLDPGQAEVQDLQPGPDRC